MSPALHSPPMWDVGPTRCHRRVRSPASLRAPSKTGSLPGLLLVLSLVLLARSTAAQYFPLNESKSVPERPAGHSSAHLLDRDADSQSSTSTSIYLVSHSDFCLFGPPSPFADIESSGLQVVSWCSSSGHGTRLIPDGVLHGVTYVKAQGWVQVSGSGDFTKINIAPGDQGGQLDSSQNTPQGAQVFVSDNNDAAQSWVMIISATTFCLRACTNPSFCPTSYAEMGCWFYTGNSVGPDGSWQDCTSDEGDPPGIVDGSTFTVGAATTPTPSAPSLSGCSSGSSVANGQSQPPLYSWDASGSASPETGTQTDGGGGMTTSAASGAAGTSGDGSTTWVQVTTCTPCSSGESASTAAPSTPGGGTTQVGMTPISGVDLVHESMSGASGTSAGQTTATTSATSTAAGGGGGLLGKRDTTSKGQCCSTTWTPSVIGAGPTAAAVTSGGGVSTWAGSANGTSKPSGSAVNGSLPNITSSITGVSGAAQASGASNPPTGAVGGVPGGSATDGTGNASSWGAREIAGCEDGSGRLLLAVLFGTVGAGLIGGWSLC